MQPNMIPISRLCVLIPELTLNCASHVRHLCDWHSRFVACSKDSIHTAFSCHRKNQGRRLPPISYSPDEETERPIERPGRRLDEFTSLNSLLSRMTINIGTESTFIFDSSGVTSNLPSWLTPDWLGFAGYGILSDITVANLKLDGDNPLSIKVGSPPDSRWDSLQGWVKRQ